MDVSSAGSAPIKPVIQPQIQSPTGSDRDAVSRTDRDNDSDNAQASSQSSPPARSTPASGTGAYVDKTA